MHAIYVFTVVPSCAVTVKATGALKFTVCPWVKLALPIFMVAFAAAVMFTFTALMSEATVRGALFRVVVPPAEGTGNGKFSSPKAMAETEASLLPSTMRGTVPTVPLPSEAAAVIVIVPGAIRVTVPEASIEALVGSELVHVTACAASLGDTVAVSLVTTAVPMRTEGSEGLTAMVLTFGVTLRFSVLLMLLPSLEVAVMVTRPFNLPVTIPVGPTAALLSSLLVQVSSLLAALDGSTTTPSQSGFYSSTAGGATGDLMVMPVTKTSVTVTPQLGVFVGSLTLVTVMTAVPAARAVTAPVAETLAFAASELSKVTLLSVASAGVTFTSNCLAPPTCKGKTAGTTVRPSRGLAVAVTVMTQAAVFVGSITLFTVTVA